MLDAPAGTRKIYSFPEYKSDVFKTCVSQPGVAACVTSFAGYSGLPTQDPASRARLGTLIDKAVNDVASLTADDIAELAVFMGRALLHTRQASNELRGVDLTLNKSLFGDTPESPAGSSASDPPVVFNTCLDAGSPKTKDEGFFAYATMVHEAGHALGLSNFSYAALFEGTVASSLPERLRDLLNFDEDQQPYEVAHPTIPDSAMNYDQNEKIRHPGVGTSFSEPDCSPHPFDLMAIFALYQSVAPPLNTAEPQ